MEVVVHPSGGLQGRLLIQGSKNYTSRYLLAAALSAGDSEIVNGAPIDDAMALIDCCRRLGAEVEFRPGRWRVRGTGGRLKPLDGDELPVRNAGFVARLMLAVSVHVPRACVVTTHPDSLGRRPQKGLLDALRQWGAEVESLNGDDRLPICVGRGRTVGGPVEVDGTASSQFLSALLFAAPILPQSSEIRVGGPLVSKVAVRQTLQVLAESGIEVEASEDLLRFTVPGGQSYRPGVRRVPGDWPSAAAVMAAAAVAGGDVEIEGLFADEQGERAAVEVLSRMGADVRFDPKAGRVRVRRLGPLRPVEFDGDRATDAVLALVAAAAYAHGVSRFYNVGNLRWKESDRIYDYCEELRRLGVHAEPGPDQIVVHGGRRPEGGCACSARHDHRVLQGLAIAALGARQPVRLQEAEHIAKSYPRFFSDLASLGARCELPAGFDERVEARPSPVGEAIRPQEGSGRPTAK